MEKSLVDSNFKAVSSAAFISALVSNDKNVGTAAVLDEGMKITLKSFDYIDGHRIVDKDTYDAVEDSQKHRYTPNDDGTYTVDNSYYGVICEGAVSVLSFRTLTSAASAPKLFPEGSIVIPAGRASQVAQALKPYLGKTIEVTHVESWKENEEWNGRKQRFEGRAVSFKVVEGEVKGE
jgi:hypothetical protein